MKSVTIRQVFYRLSEVSLDGWDVRLAHCSPNNVNKFVCDSDYLHYYRPLLVPVAKNWKHVKSDHCRASANKDVFTRPSPKRDT